MGRKEVGATRVWLQGGGGDLVVLPGFQKLQREKQAKDSPLLGIRERQGARRAWRGDWKARAYLPSY